MPYRILSCTICGAMVRFARDRERKMVKCPECGTGMDLAPGSLVPRLKLVPLLPPQTKADSAQHEASVQLQSATATQDGDHEVGSFRVIAASALIVLLIIAACCIL